MRTLDIYDQYAAAYALARGAILVEVEPVRAHWVRYHFNNSTGFVSQLLHEWSEGGVAMPARTYAIALKTVKHYAKEATSAA